VLLQPTAKFFRSKRALTLSGLGRRRGAKAATATVRKIPAKMQARRIVVVHRNHGIGRLLESLENLAISGRIHTRDYLGVQYAEAKPCGWRPTSSAASAATGPASDAPPDLNRMGGWALEPGPKERARPCLQVAPILVQALSRTPPGPGFAFPRRWRPGS